MIAGLESCGFNCRHIAQEHSYVPQMWLRITHPDLLIFLQCSFPVSTQRRKLSWREDDFLEQQRRLSHAHQHADFIIDTDLLTSAQVLEKVMAFLKGQGL